MKWFYNMKIAGKLLTGFVIVAIIAGVVGGVGIKYLNEVSKVGTQLYEVNTLGINYIGNATIYFQRMRFNAVKLILLGGRDLQAQADTINNLNEYIAANDEFLKKYENLNISEENKAVFNKVKPHWEKYKAYTQETINLVKSERFTEAENLLLGDFAAVGNSLQEAFANVVDYNTDRAQQRADNNTSIAETAQMIMIAVVIAGVIIAIILGLFISRMISKPVRKLVDVADQLAIGNVNVNVQADTKDEIGNLMESFNKMIANIRGQALAAERIAEGDLTVNVEIKSENDLLGKKLAEMVEKNNEVLNNIASASEQVASGAKQVSDSSIALSQGATEQASSIEELTASIEEIAAQTKKNAENANLANELAEQAKENAIQGNDQMKEMLKAMDEINDSSNNISKIIKVIDEIAFQTNILALNAAVEAARAGQHGKGFAVVAEEVRNLAARSANAAKETTDMIEGSIKKVEGGTRIANETAVALNKIVEDVAQAANLVNEIAIASNEQATGINQVNQGVMQVSQVVQTNSATSEESAAASEELSSQAELLKQQVSKFKLKKTDHTSYRSFEGISPEVLRMLEGMSEKSKPNDSQAGQYYREAATAKIALSDKEFGKY